MTHSEWIDLTEQMAAHCRRAQDALQRADDSILADPPQESRIRYVLAQAETAIYQANALYFKAIRAMEEMGYFAAPGDVADTAGQSARD